MVLDVPSDPYDLRLLTPLDIFLLFEIVAHFLHHFYPTHKRHIEICENQLVSGVYLVGLFNLLEGFLAAHEEVDAVLNIDAAIEEDGAHHCEAKLLVVNHHNPIVKILFEFVELVDYRFPFLDLLEFVNLQAWGPCLGDDLIIGADLAFHVACLTVGLKADWELFEHEVEGEYGAAVLF